MIVITSLKVNVLNLWHTNKLGKDQISQIEFNCNIFSNLQSVTAKAGHANKHALLNFAPDVKVSSIKTKQNLVQKKKNKNYNYANDK